MVKKPVKIKKKKEENWLNGHFNSNYRELQALYVRAIYAEKKVISMM
jgi:hypothetical protein